MIEYDGIIWNGPDKKGYYKKRINGKQWYLHRYVYEKENGPLIKNMDIHHIDFNKENNDSSNLVQLTRTEHIKIHKIGIKFSDEHKNNISKGRTGIKFSDEHKNNISKGRIGKIVSNETRMKLSTAGKGRKHTIDTKKKMSESHQGKHDVKIRQIETGIIFQSIKDAVKFMKLKSSGSCIYNCLIGVSKTSCGFHWEYV